MNNFFNFDKMITPQIIKILFWIGLVISVLMGLITMITAVAAEEAFGVLFGLFSIVLGPIFVRVYCELLIIMFKIHETLNDIKNK